MEKGKAVVTFIVGSAVGMGAGLLMSRLCKERTRFNPLPSKREREEQLSTPYCDVPEGADICFPKQTS